MTSPFANIFTALQERITAEVPEIIFIDMDYGQLEAKERPAVAFPCVLINLRQYRFSELSKLSQQAEGTLLLKLATDPYSSTSNITPAFYKEAALNILELEQSLFKALHGWRPIDGSPLIRINYDTDNRRPGIKVQEMAFSHSFQDHTAQRTTTLIPKPTPIITTTITT